MATKKVKVPTTTIDFTNSVDKIKSTAKTVNTEVVNTAIEVLEDLRINGKKISQAATARVNEVIEKATVKNGIKFAKETAEAVNEYSVETVEEIVEEVVKGSKEWQKLAEKLLDGSVKIYGTQQEMVFDTFDSLKKQYETGTFRFKNLFDFSFFNRKTSTVDFKDKVSATTKRVVKKATLKAKAAKEVAVKATSTAKTTAKKVTVKATKPAAKKTTTTKTASKKATVTKNNLKLIEGVGPKIEGLLNQAGIFTFQQLANAKQVTLKGILAKAGARYKMYNPTTWNQQATLAAAGKKEALAKLKDELKSAKTK